MRSNDIYAGNKRYRLVSIHIKCNQLLLSLTKKYLGSVLTSRECKTLLLAKNFILFMHIDNVELIFLWFPDTILYMVGELHKTQGYYVISLQTDGGDLKLLFQNEKQRLIWMSTIDNFLNKSRVASINII